jgi:hypothetical protein
VSLKREVKKIASCFNTTPRKRIEGHAAIAKRMLGISNLQSRSNHFNFREMYAGDCWPGPVSLTTTSPRHESNPGRRGATIAAQTGNLTST